MSAFTKVEGDNFAVKVYDLEADHEKLIQSELYKKGICVDGYEITSSKYFMYGCPVFGILPGDCRGEIYFGHCTEARKNL